MGTPAKFRLSLKASPTTWYAEDNTGVITQATPYYIDDPEGWEEVDVTNSKNIDLSGLDRDHTIHYRFVGDAQRILRHIDYTQGSEGVCQLVIEIRDDITWDYNLFTPAPLDLDFSIALDERDAFNIPVKEAGLPVMIRANMDTEFQVPISAHPNKLTVDVTPLVAQAEIKWVTETLAVNYPTTNPNTDGHITDTFARMLHVIGVKKTFIPTSDGGDYSPVTMGVLSTASTVQLGTPEGQFPTPKSTVTSQWNQVSTTGFPYLIKPKVALTDVSLKGSFLVTLFNASGGSLTINFKVAKLTFPGGVQTETVLWTGTSHTLATGTGTSFTETINATGFDLAIGEELIVFYTPTAVIGGSGFDITIEQGRYLTATFRYETEPFSFYALRGKDVGDSLIDQITNGAYPFESDLITQTTAIIDSIPNNVLWTSGIAIRSQPLGTTILGATYLKITLGEYFKTYNVLYGGGMSVESETARIERKSRYFDKDTVIADIGEAVDCRVEKAKEYKFNRIKIGFPSVTYDEVNGLDEYNTTHTYTAENNRESKELDLVTSVRADMWGIFFEWVKYVLEESKDSASDNNAFILEVKTTPNGGGHYEPVTGADIVSLSGVIDPDNSFNPTLSPKHCFFRNGDYIRGGMYPQETKTIKFLSADKNPDMISNTGSGTINENADVVVNTLDAPLFYPWIFTVDAPTTYELLTLLDANPYGVIRWTWRGVELEGFPIEVTVKPAIPEQSQIKLLGSPLNDMSLLE